MRGSADLLSFVDVVLQQRGVCCASDKAHPPPTAGTSQASAMSRKLQADLRFSGDSIALHVADVSYKYSFLIPVRSGHPLQVWGALRIARIAIFGRPKCDQTGGGGGGANGKMNFGRILARGIALSSSFRERARPLFLEGGNGPARGIFSRLAADGRFSSKQNIGCAVLPGYPLADYRMFFEWIFGTPDGLRIEPCRPVRAGERRRRPSVCSATFTAGVVCPLVGTPRYGAGGRAEMDCQQQVAESVGAK